MRPYVNPLRAGVLLGLVLLASFLFAHRGIGASGAFAATAGAVLGELGYVPTDLTLADRLPVAEPLSGSWILLEIAALMLGGYLSARAAGRLASRDRSIGADGRAAGSARVWRALSGGVLMGVGARLAYGCTSGLALSGGALLATGAWIFIPLAFASAILVTLAAHRREAR